MGECLVIRSSGGVDTSKATATKETLVSGYTCYTDGELVVGTIPSNTIEEKIVPGFILSIPYGYYDSTNLISVSTLKEETVGSAVSSDILEDKTGWVDGNDLIGIMFSHENIEYTLSANETYTIPIGWYNNSNYIKQTLLTQGKITFTPNTDDHIICQSGRLVTEDIVIVGDINLIAENIKNGIVLYGVTGTFIGWVDDTWTATNYSSGGRAIPLSSGPIALYDYTYDIDTLLNLKQSFSWITISSTVNASAAYNYDAGWSYVSTTTAYYINGGGAVNLASAMSGSRQAYPNSNSDTRSVKLELTSIDSIRIYIYTRADWKAQGSGSASMTVNFSKI